VVAKFAQFVIGVYAPTGGCSIARTYAWIENLVKENLAQSETVGDELAHSKVIK